MKVERQRNKQLTPGCLVIVEQTSMAFKRIEDGVLHGEFYIKQGTLGLYVAKGKKVEGIGPATFDLVLFGSKCGWIYADDIEVVQDD